MISRFIYLLAVVVSLSWAAMVQAQTPVEQSTLALRIEGLTSEVRDKIQRDLKGSEDLRLLFSCVPAGILVFEQGAGHRGELRARVDQVMEHRVARQRITEQAWDLRMAEERCAQVRNQ